MVQMVGCKHENDNDIVMFSGCELDYCCDNKLERALCWLVYEVDEVLPWFFQFVRQFHTLAFHRMIFLTHSI